MIDDARGASPDRGAYERLVEAYDEMSLIFGLAERLSMRRAEPDVLRLLLEIVAQVVPLRDSAVLWKRDGAFELAMPVAGPLGRAVEVAVSDGAIDWALAQERAVPGPARGRQLCLIHLPLVGLGGSIGVVVLRVDSKVSEIRAHQLRTLSLLGRHAAGAIESARLYQSIEEQNAALKELSADLEVSRLKLERWSSELETQVAERTAELQSAHELLRTQHEDLRKAHQAQDQVNLRLQEVDRLKSEFLQTISHELKTPLNAIIGYAEVLLDGIAGSLNETQRHHSENIRVSGRHLLGLIVELLDLTSVEAGRVDLRRQEFRLGTALREALAFVGPCMEGKRLSLETHGMERTGIIRADEAKIRQIVGNLLQNAATFTPEGGTLALRLEVESGEAGDVAHLIVSDDGPGIPAEATEVIFERFSRLEPSVAGGTGLGLYISRRLAELHGGEVWAVSPADRPVARPLGPGTSFHVRLPWLT